MPANPSSQRALVEVAMESLCATKKTITTAIGIGAKSLTDLQGFESESGEKVLK